mmetsp:Transcript_41720/g.104838  ORF Transcript_41720/g.104838 Transcript_41720/m.104838 type:complete len:95 (-) Transcript_41720:1452-1736(-)
MVPSMLYNPCKGCTGQQADGSPSSGAADSQSDFFLMGSCDVCDHKRHLWAPGRGAGACSNLLQQGTKGLHTHPLVAEPILGETAHSSTPSSPSR